MDHILGQDEAIKTLRDALASGRFHHAWIFSGPEGVGKYTTALAMAQLLLCFDRQIDLTGTAQPCRACDACRLLQSTQEGGAHPDLHIITKELAAQSRIAALRTRKQMTLPVDLLRELILGGKTSDGKYQEAPAAKCPALGHGKVFIIDEADLMAPIGQNALLKTLEEPPPATYFILITAQPDRLLDTIRSRCQKVAFAMLEDKVVTQWVRKQTTDLSDRQIQWLVRFAQGSLGRANLILAYDLVQWAKQLLKPLDNLVAGHPAPTLGALMAENIDALASRWVTDHPGSSKEAANQMAASLMWNLLADHARYRLHQLAAGLKPDNPQHAEQILEPWLRVIDCLTTAQQMLEAHVNLGMVTDHLVSQIAGKIPVVTGLSTF